MKKTHLALPLCMIIAACGILDDEKQDKADRLQSPAPTHLPIQATAVSSPSSALPPAVSQSLIGEWTELDRKCAVGPLGDGNGDGIGDDIANMEIRADGYGGYEWGCDLKPKVGAASTYNGKSICYSEGEASPPTRISFEIMADGKLKMTTPEGKTVMKRCK